MRTLVRVLVVLFVTFALGAAASAKWLPVHSVESEKPLAVIDGDTGKTYTPDLGDSVSSWQESTHQAFSHAIALAGGNLYELRLVSIGGSDADTITGLWDVYKNGVLACSACVGKAYNLSAPAGDYFKIYVGTPLAYAEKWHFSGYITHRFDY